MREAIGNALLLNIIVTVLAVMMIFLVSSLSYTKAFKIKNNILNIIENYGYITIRVDRMLEATGYRIIKGTNKTCEVAKPGLKHEILTTSRPGTYRYCVVRYEINRGDLKGHYYGVTAYMYFDLPLIGEMLEYPVYGETRVIYD
jgi:hypothetical protein